MLGSDVVGSARNMGAELSRYKPLLDAISRDPNDSVRRNLARDNFVRLMSSLQERRFEKMDTPGALPANTPPTTGIILKHDYEFDSNEHTGAPERSFIRENMLKP